MPSKRQRHQGCLCVRVAWLCAGKLLWTHPKKQGKQSLKPLPFTLHSNVHKHHNPHLLAYPEIALNPSWAAKGIMASPPTSSRIYSEIALLNASQPMPSWHHHTTHTCLRAGKLLSQWTDRVKTSLRPLKTAAVPSPCVRSRVVWWSLYSLHAITCIYFEGSYPLLCVLNTFTLM